MNVNFNGYGENVATFIADSSLTETGVPVKVSADGTVAKCAKNDVFCGVCTGLRAGYATVQLSGYAKMKAGAKIAVGYKRRRQAKTALWQNTHQAENTLCLTQQQQASALFSKI